MDTNLLSGLVESEEESHTPGFRVIKMSGEPYANALVGAVIENYNRVTGRPKPRYDELLGRVGEKITLIRSGQNMIGAGILNAIEGKLFENSGGLGILPKGARSKGYRVDPDRVLDILDGYATAQAAELAARVRLQYPDLRNLTQERLEQLPRDSETCSLALLGGNPVFGGADCIWLIGEYWPDDDICDTNVLLIRPEFGTSEHGSCYGQELLSNRRLGEIVGFEPISFSDAIKLCDRDFDDASDVVLGARVAA